ncbi:GntR family transcriptional regulator [Roseomonas sp. E05]|uniref:GntR family transcriptional regulator n=1 Tax=Roseomonas sp. E05 TaxID=3046310 RepID=UPI0024BAA366|nr:GntR family transcriptional regulator [Roseomonas sp. E05]MDJ0390703.1 GntR family transcriptional regulator [Roseomonas sp. E05]
MPNFKAGVTAAVERVRGSEGQSLVQQACDAIVHAIARGVFLPGDRMVEAYIAEDLGFSRVPVREALRGLEHRGLLHSPDKGLRLIVPTQRDVEELVELRRMMESAALRHAMARQGGPDRWNSLRDALREGRAAAAARDATRAIVADRRFHEALWREAGHELLLSSLIQLWQRQLVMCTAMREQIDFKTGQADHEGILAAIEAGDWEEAERRLTAHGGWLAQQDFAAALKGAREARRLAALRAKWRT